MANTLQPRCSPDTTRAADLFAVERAALHESPLSPLQVWRRLIARLPLPGVPNNFFLLFRKPAETAGVGLDS